MWKLCDKLLGYDNNVERSKGFWERIDSSREILSLTRRAISDEHIRRESEGRYAPPQLGQGEVVYGLRLAMELSGGEIQREVRQIINDYNFQRGHGDKIQSIQVRNLDNGETQQWNVNEPYQKAA